MKNTLIQSLNCIIWFTQPIFALVIVNQAQDADKIVSLIRALYNNSVSCVRASQSESSWFTIETGVRQGYVLAPDSLPLVWTGCWKELLVQDEDYPAGPEV